MIDEELEDNDYGCMTEDRQEARADMNSALKNKADWVVNWYKRESRSTIINRWELGAQLLDVEQDKLRNSAKTYGTGAMEKLAKYLGEDVSTLRTAVRLAEAYTKREIEDISEMTMTDRTTPLSYSHIRVLITVDDKKKRHELLNQALESCWSSERLGKEVQQLQGTTSNNPSGRVGKPKTADSVINQQLDYVEDFETRNAKVWKDPSTSLIAQIERMEPVEYTEELANKLAELAHRLRQLATEAIARAEEAESKHKEVRRILDGKPIKLPSAVANEEDDVPVRQRGFRKSAAVGL